MLTVSGHPYTQPVSQVVNSIESDKGSNKNVPLKQLLQKYSEFPAHVLHFAWHGWQIEVDESG